MQTQYATIKVKKDWNTHWGNQKQQVSKRSAAMKETQKRNKSIFQLVYAKQASKSKTYSFDQTNSIFGLQLTITMGKKPVNFIHTKIS